MRLASLFAVFAIVLSAGPEFAAQANSSKSRFMRVHGQAIPPYGFIQFCESYRSECQPGQRRNARFTASLNRLIELDEINRRVNRAVKPATDSEIYGVEEYWTFPNVQGDCEDYVVLKRRLLMKAGWPASALLITVVMDENNDGHAVLTARTAQGDFVLDNKTAQVKLWSQTPYRYVMRQSFIDPNLWMSLDPQATVTPQSMAGLRTQ
ncbi:MAG: transglutaminase-like cysteine peptidase [Hyphomicrobiaceae bacterium]